MSTDDNLLELSLGICVCEIFICRRVRTKKNRMNNEWMRKEMRRRNRWMEWGKKTKKHYTYTITSETQIRYNPAAKYERFVVVFCSSHLKSKCRSSLRWICERGRCENGWKRSWVFVWCGLPVVEHDTGWCCIVCENMQIFSK